MELIRNNNWYKISEFFNSDSKYAYKAFDTSLFPTADYLQTISKNIYETNFNNFNMDSLNSKENIIKGQINDFSNDYAFTDEEISKISHHN